MRLLLIGALAAVLGLSTATAEELPASAEPTSEEIPDPYEALEGSDSLARTVGRLSGGSEASKPLEAVVEELQTRLESAEQRIEVLEAQKLSTRVGTLEESSGDTLLTAQTDQWEQIGKTLQVPAGTVTERAVGLGGPVVVSGRVTGHAVSFGGDVHVMETGRVDGDIVSFGGEVIVHPGGKVKGDRLAMSGQSAAESIGRMPSGFGPDGAIHKLVLFLALGGIGVLVVGLFPDRVERVSDALQTQPLRYVLAGIATTVTVAVTATLLAVTLLGLPLAALLLLFTVGAWLVGFVALCQAAGDQLPLGRHRGNATLTFLVGVALLFALGLLPVVGPVIFTLTLFPCIGAAAATRFGISRAS